MREVAESNVDGINKVTSEQTVGGKRFDDMQLFEDPSPIRRDQALEIWKTLSRRYAQDASGEATAWTHDSWAGQHLEHRREESLGRQSRRHQDSYH